ncbi:MAG: ABC transporter ATP-binding protein [Planctomycetota bacterium]
MIRFENLEFAYRRAAPPVVRAITAEITPGVTVLLGPNGSGKSTLLRLALGVLCPTAGHALLDGRPAHTWRGLGLKQRIAYLDQRPSVSTPFTVHEVVALAASREHADAAIEQLDLAARAHTRFAELSVGQQQRAMLARVVAQATASDRPLAVLADEPMSALDPAHALLAAEVLRALADAGHVVFTAVHDFTIASRLADRALLLDARGQIARQGRASDVLAPEPLAGVFGVAFRALQDGAGPPALVPDRPVA